MDLAAQIKIIAFKEVRDSTAEYHLRHVYRWYSAKFATPLHLVPSLPFSDILTAYFEDQFENMDADELEEERRLLTETEGQRLERIAAKEAEEASEADFLAMAETEAKRLESTKIPEQPAVRPINHPHKQAKEADLPEPISLPPDVTVKFVDDSFFENLMDEIDNDGTTS